MTVGSVAAMALGVYAVWTQVHGAARGRDFEGYIVLMGVGLAAHGLVLAGDLVLSRRSPAPGPLVRVL